MTDIPSVSLVDTLNVIQLARETALAKGAGEQAQRFEPVINEIHELVMKSKKNPEKSATPSGVMGQEDFRCLLSAPQGSLDSQENEYTQSVVERNQLINSMAASNMTDLEIARQLEITREEVDLVISLYERGQYRKEIIQ